MANFTLTLSNKAEQTLLISMIGFIEQSIAIKNESSFYQYHFGRRHCTIRWSCCGGIWNTEKRYLWPVLFLMSGPKIWKTHACIKCHKRFRWPHPGLVTRQESGRPGGDQATMFVRGRASLNDSNPFSIDWRGRTTYGANRPWWYWNHFCIEKDASATAVYGVRGANGVILVTTRRGREGETRISFSSEFGVTSFNRISQTLNAESVSRFMREGTINDGFDPSDTGNTRGLFLSEYDNYLYRTQKSPFTHPDNDFVDMFTQKWSPTEIQCKPIRRK